MCEYMYLNNVDVACISETNCHWKNITHYIKWYENVLNTLHLATSETKTPWPTIYKHRGTATITITTFSARSKSSGKYSHELGRWYYTTFGSSNEAQLKITNAYRTCQQSTNWGVSTTHFQKWDILEEINK